MRAAVIREPRRVEIAESAEIPEPGANQLLVRLEGCGVCASNIPPWEGKPWFNYPMAPGALGHEGWGRVEALGEDVTELRARRSRRDDLEPRLRGVRSLRSGRDREAARRRLAINPFPAEPLGCAMNIFKRAQIEQVHTVAIVGIGFLGALLTQLASGMGARVIAISRRAVCARVRAADGRGAHHRR